MAVSTVDICNQALGWLGADPITSLDDSSKEAQLCKENFANLRDTVLEEREWTFAVRRFRLSPMVKKPVYGYAEQFLLPPEVLRVLNIPASRGEFGGLPFLNGGAGADTQEGLFDWRVESIDEGNVILANISGTAGQITSNIRVRAIVRVTNEKLWSSMFVQALAQRIAADLAMALTNSFQIARTHWTLYESKLGAAATMDGMQGKSEVKRSDNLINVR
jgi:hypothetical protein